jgi:NAD(P)-dependent dehydrogenase (short-subunit alcohol dehydrogenase family)
MGRLDGAVAVVTGGGAGIGRATAARFAAEGARVVVADLDGEAAATTAKAVGESGGDAAPLTVDVRDAHAVTVAFDEVERTRGPIEVLVNCAGGSLDDDGPLHTLGEEALDATFELDLRGTMLCCRAALGQMRRAGRGRIVNLASFHALGGDSPVHAYAAAKGGVVALTRSLAARYATDGIRVNAIAPGIVLTDRVRGRIARDGTDLTALRARHPFAVGEPDDVARVALFLAGADSCLVTGATLPADGGLTLW